MSKRKVSTRPSCCSLKSLKTADDCPFGLGCLNSLNCDHKKCKSDHSSKINQLKRKKNPKNGSKPPRNNRRRKR